MNRKNEKLSNNYLSEESLAKHTTAEPTQESQIRGGSVPINIPERLFLIYRPIAPFLLLVSIALLAIAILTSLNQENQEPLITESTEMVPDIEIESVGGDYSAAELQRELNLREALIEERGGRLFLDSLRSIKMSGTINFGEAENQIFILSMKPDRAMIRILQDEEQLNLGFDGSEFWKVVDSMNGFRGEIKPTEEEGIILRSLGQVTGPLLSLFLEGRGRIISVEEGEFNDLPFIKVAFAESVESNASEVHLNPTDLSLLRWERQDELGNVHVFHYGEYEEFDGNKFPTQIEYWRNGELQFEVDLENVTPNFGAVQMLFWNPLPKDR